MDWLPYGIIALIVLFVVFRLLPPRGVKVVSADDLQEALKDPKGKQVIDVRDPGEYKSGHIQGARNIPLAQISTALNGIPKDRETYLICATGFRSAQGCRILQKHGFKQLYNVAGGMKQWKGKVIKK